ncbi:MAG: CGP-CTERM sorting domain-containing protein [Thermococci archaeon]|nr:CGP-CTERM sorting domain-containing protein [Thermococci archaeon]
MKKAAMLVSVFVLFGVFGFAMVSATTVAVDLAHGESTLGLNQMIPAMKQYQWAYFGSPGQLPSNLSVKNLGSTITADALNGVDVLILGQPTQPLTMSEIAAISQWFKEGGKVLWIAGDSDYGSGVKTQNNVNTILSKLGLGNLRVDLCSVSDPVSNAGAGYRVVAYDKPDSSTPYRSILVRNLQHDGKVLFHGPGPVAWVDSNGKWHNLTGPVPSLHIYRIVVSSKHAKIVENNMPQAHAYTAGNTGVYTLMAAQIIKLSNGKYDVLIVSGETPYGGYQPIWDNEYHGVQLDGHQFVENAINWSITTSQKGLPTQASSGGKGICGPASIVALALVPLLLYRRRK